MTVNYVEKTLHELPKFYATRVTRTFRRELCGRTNLSIWPVDRDTEIYQDDQTPAQITATFDSGSV